MTPVVITGQVGGHFRSSKPRAPKLRSGIIARGCRNGEELVQILEGRLREEGLNVRLDAEATQVDRLPVGKRVTLHVSGKDDTFVAGELLLATGRRPTWRAGIGTAGGEISWNAIPGISVDVEAAQWNDTTPNGGQDRGFNALAAFDLAKLLGTETKLIVGAGYAYFGPNFYPPYGNVSLDNCCWDFLYPGNSQGFIASATWTFTPGWTIFGTYLTGNHVSNSQPIQEYEVNLRYQFAPNSSVLLKYRDLRINGIDQFNVYRAQLDYKF